MKSASGSSSPRRSAALLRSAQGRLQPAGERAPQRNSDCRARCGRWLAPDDAALASAKAKADDLEAKLHQGGDFTQLAKSFSEGSTAAEGGDLGQYRRGALAKVLEDKTFALNSGQYTDPIRTKQGFVILKVVQHVPGGVQDFKNVEQEVEQSYYMSRMEPPFASTSPPCASRPTSTSSRATPTPAPAPTSRSIHLLCGLYAARAQEKEEG